jgi:sec-independent protein translocase protein TatB
MLPSMFGIGGSEILVILVIALLFLGPDKLPEAAKTISKGIRDLKKQSRALQTQIESDEKIGGAIRDLKSALRGEDAPVRPPVRIQPPKVDEPQSSDALAEATEPPYEEVQPALTLPETAGEPGDVEDDGHDHDIGSLIKPAAGTVAKSEGEPTPSEPKQKHG